MKNGSMFRQRRDEGRRKKKSGRPALALQPAGVPRALALQFSRGRAPALQFAWGQRLRFCHPQP